MANKKSYRKEILFELTVQPAGKYLQRCFVSALLVDASNWLPWKDSRSMMVVAVVAVVAVVVVVVVFVVFAVVVALERQ